LRTSQRRRQQRFHVIATVTDEKTDIVANVSALTILCNVQGCDQDEMIVGIIDEYM
jgi:hypothetical protein